MLVSSSNSPRQMNLIDGVVQNLTITDDEGKRDIDNDWRIMIL